MLGVAVDMLVLAGMMAVLQDREPEWVRILIVAVILAVANLALSLLLGGLLGLFILLPMALVDGVIVFLMCGLTPKQAGLTVGALIGARLVLALLFVMLWRTPDKTAVAASIDRGGVARGSTCAVSTPAAADVVTSLV
jgi:hypothetical protein